MARWQDVVDSEPEFAARVQALFDAGRHKSIATLRKDGGPRISGIEAQFANGELWLGMMANSQKLRDVQRDPRIALHSPSTSRRRTPSAVTSGPATPSCPAAWCAWTSRCARK